MTDESRFGSCQALLGNEREKCSACGWILFPDPFACLEHEDVTHVQVRSIELKLAALAQTGPQRPRESYRARVEVTRRRLILEGLN